VTDDVGYLNMHDLVTGKLVAFSGLNIFKIDELRRIQDKSRDTMSLAFDNDFSPGSAIINPEYKQIASVTNPNDRTITADFWFTIFDMEKPSQEQSSIIPEIVFKFFLHSQTEAFRNEFPLRFTMSNDPSPLERFYYNVQIPFKKDGSSQGSYQFKNLWSGDNDFPTSTNEPKVQPLLSKQWYYFRVSLVRYYEQKSYYLQVLIFSPSNPYKLILYLDKEISNLMDLTVDSD
jgi:hypothetical protein